MIESIEIQGLRGIRQGKVEGLAPLTVLLGPSGGGKSTLLEALLMATSSDPLQAIGRSVWRRPELTRGARWLFWRGGHDSLGIRLEAKGGAGTRVSVLSIRVGEDYLPRFEGLPKEKELRPWTGIYLEDGQGGEVGRVAFSATNLYLPHHLSQPAGGAKVVDAEVRMVDQRIGVLRPPLHTLRTATLERGRDCLSAATSVIQRVIPAVTGLDVATEADIPVLHLVFPDRSVPVAVAGDGVESLVRLALELTGRAGGTVLVEEPEAHQHMRAIVQSAEVIAECVRAGTQIILSTHSLELLDALLWHFARDLGRFAVFRLVLGDDGTLAARRVAGERVAVLRGDLESDLRRPRSTPEFSAKASMTGTSGLVC